MEAGEKSSALLRARGWSAIMLDDYLISNALLLTSLVIGGCTGCFEMFVVDIIMKNSNERITNLPVSV
jgi:hypothetical protein